MNLDAQVDDGAKSSERVDGEADGRPAGTAPTSEGAPDADELPDGFDVAFADAATDRAIHDRPHDEGDYGPQASPTTPFVAEDSTQTGESQEADRTLDASTRRNLELAEWIADRVPRSVGEQVRGLARAAFSPDATTSEVLGWSGVDLFRAFDPLELAERAAHDQDDQIQRRAEWAASLRNVLVFAPVLFTWIGLGIATLTYATCRVASGATETPSFLFLWQRGFVADGVTCDLNASLLQRLPLSTFGEVVVVDTATLLLIIGLTIASQLLASKAESAREMLLRMLVADLRVFLVEASRRLHLVRMAEDAAARQTLFVTAFGTLETVAKDFSGTAQGMIRVLENRSREAEEHLARLTETYKSIADDARNATSLLARVLSSTTRSAEELSLGVANAGREFAALGGRLDLAASEVKNLGGSLKEIIAVERSIQQRANDTALKNEEIAASVARLATIDASLRELTQIGGWFETAGTGLRRMETSMNDLLGLDRSAQKRFDETALNTHAIAESITTLTNINENIRNLALEIRRSRGSDRIVLPRVGWQMGVGAIGLLALFQLFTAAVVWSDRAGVERDLAPVPVASSEPRGLPLAPEQAPGETQWLFDVEPTRGPR